MPDRRVAATEPIEVALRVRGRFPDAELESARDAVGAVIGRHRDRVRAVRMRLTGANCDGGPALVQVNLRVGDLDGRVQVSGQPVNRAVAAATVRLDRLVRRLTGSVSEPRPWPDPQRRPLAIRWPGRITHPKVVELRSCTPVEAAFVMDAMDYEAHLFADVESGEDAIVYRGGPTGRRLMRQRGMRPPSAQGTPPFVTNARPVPVLSTAAAADRLTDVGLPWLFFTDRRTGRGRLVYRRYDAELGLVMPAESPAG